MKIAVISSYGVPCGPACFSEYLVEQIKESSYQPVILKLDQFIFRSNSKNMQSLTKRTLIDIVSKANQCDKIFWQFEPGLLSSSPALGYKRARWLLKRLDNDKIVLTIHGFNRPSNVSKSVTSFLIDALRRKKINIGLADTRLLFSYSYWKFLQELKKIRVICYSKHDITELRSHNIDAKYYPICYLKNEVIKEYNEKRGETRAKIAKKDFPEIKDNEDLFLSVLPGFVASYKNPIMHIAAVEYLAKKNPDKKYVTIIAGGPHPHGNSQSCDFQKDLNLLLIQPDEFFRSKRTNGDDSHPSKTKKKRSIFDALGSCRANNHQVVMTGNLTQHEMNEYVSVADAVVQPYLDSPSGQSGSGPFCLAVELAQNAIFSAARVFTGQEFLSYTDYNVVSVNSTRELALKIENIDETKKAFTAFQKKFKEKYNAKKQLEFYLGSS